MQILDHLEQRLALPGDSETRRSQKKSGFIVVFLAATLAALDGLHLYRAGLTASGLTFLIFSALLFFLLGVLYVVPRSYLPGAVLILVLTLITNLTAHLAGGGYTSGLSILVWIFLTPVFAVLFAGRREVLLLVAAFALTVLIAGLFEDEARANMPQLDPSFTTIESSTNYLLLGLILAGAALYLFNQIE